MAKNIKILIITVIAIATISFGAYFLYSDHDKENVLSAQEAAEKAISYLNDNILPGGIAASLVDVVKENGLYKLKLEVQEREHTSYVSKDGKILFIEGIDMDQEGEIPEAGEQEITKKEKPDIKLFVMSYCPYGLQAQKMFLPVYELLGDKVDMGVYFVDYIMHGEEEIIENLNQYCIQKEEKEKFADFLACFVKDGDSKKCLSEANIDEIKLGECFSETDTEYNIYSQLADKSTWVNGRFPKFDVHADLNLEYGVRGSPTIVINGKVVSVDPRSSENFKQVVCQSFNTPPKECEQTLSDTVFATGFGLETGGTSGGGCGE